MSTPTSHWPIPAIGLGAGAAFLVTMTVLTGPGTLTVMTGPGTLTVMTGPGTLTVTAGPGTVTVTAGVAGPASTLDRSDAPATPRMPPRMNAGAAAMTAVFLPVFLLMVMPLVGGRYNQGGCMARRATQHRHHGVCPTR